MFLKLQLYQKYGVREYWIVYPDDKSVLVHLLKDGEYTTTAYTDAAAIPVRTLEGLTISLNEIFTE